MLPGSIGCGDGGSAIQSSVRNASGGSVPLAASKHGRRPKKQYTRLAKIPKGKVCPELPTELKKQQRWNPESSSVRVTGGNQSAEGIWGTGNSQMKQRCTHRGQSKLHATANALCAMYLVRSPGLKCLGVVWKTFFLCTSTRVTLVSSSNATVGLVSATHLATKPVA